MSSISLPLTSNPPSHPVRRSPSSPSSTLLESFLEACEQNPLRPYLGERAGADVPYTYVTYGEAWSRVRSLSLALESLLNGGSSPQSSPSSLVTPIVLLPNCANWILIAAACYSRSWPTVPLYSTLGDDAMASILGQTRSTVYFVDYRMVGTVVGAVEALAESHPNESHPNGRLPKAILIVCNGSLSPSTHKSLAASNSFSEIVTLASLYSKGSSSRLSLYKTLPGSTSASTLLCHSHPLDSTYIHPPSPSTVASISYTSGTSGSPKGVVLTHKNLTSLITAIIPSRVNITRDSHHFSYLPLPHIFERAVVSGISSHGGTISFIRYSPDPKVQGSYLLEDLTACRPTVFCCAPRVLNKIKGGLEMALAPEGGKDSAVKMLMRHAIAAKVRGERRGRREEGRKGRKEIAKAGGSPIRTVFPSSSQLLSNAALLPSSSLLRSGNFRRLLSPPRSSLLLFSPLLSSPLRCASPFLSPFSSLSALFFLPSSLFLSSPRFSSLLLASPLLSLSLLPQLAAFSATDAVTHRIYDPLLRKLARKLGLDNVENLVCGSAPVSPSTLSFFAVLLPACKVQEGYGLTETAGGVSLTSPLAYPDRRQFGTVGEPVVGCEVKLVHVDVEEEGGGGGGGGEERGEIWVRGDNVSAGYYEGIGSDGAVRVRSIQDKDGWFRTGDVGVWDKDTGGLKIVDRIKNIFKLQQGEFVSVEKIEAIVASGVGYVEQLYCYGDGMRRFIVGVACVDEKWKKAKEAELLKEEGESRRSLADAVQEDIYAACKKSGLQGFECVRGITVAEEGFSSANGLCTPTFKLVRKALKAKFMADIERMYTELDDKEASRSRL